MKLRLKADRQRHGLGFEIGGRRQQMCFGDTDRNAIPPEVANWQTEAREYCGVPDVIDGTEEIFWMLDAENMEVLYVNPAYEAITGRPCHSLSDDPKSYQTSYTPKITHPCAFAFRGIGSNRSARRRVSHCQAGQHDALGMGARVPCRDPSESSGAS